MTNLAKPTPPPWEQDGLRGALVNIHKGVCHIAVVGDHRDSGAEALENAKLIVRCVNSHAELVATLTTIAEYAEADGSPLALSVALTARSALRAALSRVTPPPEG